MPFSACMHPAAALKAERLGDDADGQDALLTGDLRHDGRAAPVPVPPPMPAVMNTMSVSSSALEIWVRLSSAALAAHLGIAAGALAVGQLLADLDLIGSAGNVERLLIRIDRDEIHAAGSPERTMRLTTLLPPPPTPMTLILTTFSTPVSNPNAISVPPTISCRMRADHVGAATTSSVF